MKNSLNLFNTEEFAKNNSNSFTELRISTLHHPFTEDDSCLEKNTTTDITKLHLLNRQSDLEENSNIFDEIKNNNINSIIDILTKDYSQLNAINEDGYSPLHMSVKYGNLEITNFFLKMGADPNMITIKEKQTPLHFAYLFKNFYSKEIINQLLKYNAYENVLDIYLKKPKEYEKNSNISTLKKENKKSSCSSNSNIINQSFLSNNDSTLKKGTKNNNDYNNSNDIINPIKYTCLQEYKKNNSYLINDSLENIEIKDNKAGLYENLNNEIKNVYQEFVKIYNNKQKVKNLKNISRKDENSYLTETPLESIRKNNSSLNKISTTLDSEVDDKKTKNNITAIQNISDLYRTISNDEDKEYKEYIPFTTDIVKSKTKMTNNKFNIGFNYSFSENIDKKNEINLTEINESFNKFNEKNNNNDNSNDNLNNTNLAELKNWLNDIGLLNYYKNFISNRIYNINTLIDKKIFKYGDIETLLNIHIPGHCYRIISKLEADCGLIDNKIKNFLCEKNNNENNNNQLLISQEYNCFNCCNCPLPKAHKKKNDLKYFLIKYDLMNLYQNFMHNGFDNINYVILQMYSSCKIDDEILSNSFHIYDNIQRDILLKAINTEIKKIEYFLNSKEYNNYTKKDKISYGNVFFDRDENSKDYKDINGCFII